jgi:hypothetical protein
MTKIVSKFENLPKDKVKSMPVATLSKVYDRGN